MFKSIFGVGVQVLFLVSLDSPDKMEPANVAFSSCLEVAKYIYINLKSGVLNHPLPPSPTQKVQKVFNRSEVVSTPLNKGPKVITSQYHEIT